MMEYYDNYLHHLWDKADALEQERQKDIHKEVSPKNDENDNNGCGIIIGIVIFVALIIFLSLL